MSNVCTMFLFVLFFILAFVILASSQILTFPSLRVFWMFTKLPVPGSIPILGPVHQLMFLKNHEIRAFCEKHFVDGFKNRISAVWLLGVPFVLLFHPDDLKELLGNPNCTDKGIEYNCVKSWLGEGLITSKGSKWIQRRKMLTSTFHFKILEDNISTFVTHGKQLVGNMLSSNGKIITATPFIFKCTLDIICDTAMNVKLDPDDEASKEYVKAIRRVSEGLVYRILNYYLNKDWIWNLSPAGRRHNNNLKIVHSFTEKVIAHRRRGYNNHNAPDHEVPSDKKKQPFLDRLIEMDINNPGALTDKDIREEVDTFMFVGHDSTSGTVGFILWELGLNPECQEKVYQELYGIFGEDERDTCMEDLQKMQYLEKVIKEGMRLYPAAPYISRTINQDLILGDSTVLAAGFNVVVSTFYVHRNPAFYPDPEKFDPERFTSDECAKRHPFAYIPFSAGPRNCLGQKFAMMEMKVLLSMVLRSCRVESVTRKEDVNLIPLVILTTEDPILMKIHPRKTQKCVS